MNKLQNILFKLNHKPLAMLPEAYESMVSTVKELASLDLSELFEETPIYQRFGKVAVINIFGTLLPSASKLEKLFGAASYADIRKAIRTAEKDDSEVVIFNFNSPGGVTTGVSETAKAFRKLSGIKHTIAYSSDLMCSAAYWLGAQANEIIVSESAEVGSIGVYIAYLTYGRALENEGVSAVIVQQGKYKTLGHPTKDATPEELEYMNSEVSKIYEGFKAAVSVRGLGDSTMQGQTFEGEEAVDAKLADGLEDDLDTLIEFLNKI